MRMSRSASSVLFLLLSCIQAASTSPAVKGDGPLDSHLSYFTIYNLGTFRIENAIQISVPVINSTSDDITLTGVITDCNCTTVLKRPRLLKPRQKDTIELSVNIAGQGEGAATSWVRLNGFNKKGSLALDPIKLNWTYWRKYHYGPNPIILQPIETSGTISFQGNVSITGDLGSTETQVQSRDKRIEITDLSSSETQHSYRVDILAHELTSEPLKSQLIIRSFDTELNGKSIEIQADFGSLVTISPRVIRILGAKPNQSIKREIEISVSNAWQLEVGTAALTGVDGTIDLHQITPRLTKCILTINPETASLFTAIELAFVKPITATYKVPVEIINE